MGIIKVVSFLNPTSIESKMSLLYTKNRENDLVNMIAAEVHVGTQNVSEQMSNYVYKRNKDGIHYLDVSKSWEKLMVAARVVAATQAKNKKDVLIVSSRQYAQRAVLKFATATGAEYLGGKWVPGTLTNHNTKKFLEPRLIIVCDPRLDHQCLIEASYMNIPVIALADSDSPLNWVDIVDLFMYRDPEAKKAQQAEAEAEEPEVEAEAEVEAVGNTMKAFDGEDGEEK